MQIAAVTAAQRTFSTHLERTGLPRASPDRYSHTWPRALTGVRSIIFQCWNTPVSELQWATPTEPSHQVGTFIIDT